MKKWFVDCSVEIGCACEVEAETEKEAIRIVKEAGWGWNDYERDRAHFEMKAVASEIKVRNIGGRSK